MRFKWCGRVIDDDDPQYENSYELATEMVLRDNPTCSKCEYALDCEDEHGWDSHEHLVGDCDRFKLSDEACQEWGESLCPQ